MPLGPDAGGPFLCNLSEDNLVLDRSCGGTGGRFGFDQLVTVEMHLGKVTTSIVRDGLEVPLKEDELKLA